MIQRAEEAQCLGVGGGEFSGIHEIHESLDLGTSGNHEQDNRKPLEIYCVETTEH